MPMSDSVEEQKKIKLHLGCGRVYLPGYVNIDFPPEAHSLPVEYKADLYADITKLSYQSIHGVLNDCA
jgi:hypothetical protein